MNRKTTAFILSAALFAVFGGISLPAEQTGTASWYGGKFHGRQTASGEIFDTNKLTAAHRTLPFNTMVKVTNLGNGRAVTVRVNDRGPFVQGRIIDLSRTAAERLDMIGTGTARVSIEVVSQTETEKREDTLLAGGEKRFTIQVGSYSVAANARRLHTFLRDRGFTPDLESAPPRIIRVVLNDIAETEIESTVLKLRAAGINDYLIKKMQ